MRRFHAYEDAATCVDFMHMKSLSFGYFMYISSLPYQ